jgi:propionyl-CoA synthetase
LILFLFEQEKKKGVSTKLLGDSDSSELFRKKYCSDFPGFYLTGDSGEITSNGSLVIHGRVDDVMNVAGHRLTTGQIEEAVCKVPGVAECAVVAQEDPFKGHVPVAFAVIAQGAVVSKDAIVESVREFVGAFACLKTVHLVPKLPKTRSQKILRVTLRQIVDKQKVVTVPSTIEDESVIQQIIQIVSGKRVKNEQ